MRFVRVFCLFPPVHTFCYFHLFVYFVPPLFMCLIFPRSVCVLCLSPLFWWFIISVDVLPLAIIIHTLPFPYETIFDELGTNYGAHLIQLSWDFFWKLYVPLYLSYFLRNMMAPVSGFVHMGHQDQDGGKVGQMSLFSCAATQYVLLCVFVCLCVCTQFLIWNNSLFRIF